MGVDEGRRTSWTGAGGKLSSQIFPQSASGPGGRLREEFAMNQLKMGEDRRMRKLLTEDAPSTSLPVPLDLDCVLMNYTGYACENYMVQTILDYVSKGHYNTVTRPLLNQSDKVQVSTYVQLADLLDVDFVESTMSISTYIDTYW